MAARDRSLEELLAKLETDAQLGGKVVILPSARGASMLRRAFDRRQRTEGKSAWRPPEVFAWTQWLGTLWTPLLLHGHDQRLVLNAAQERALWRDIIAADHDTHVMTPVDSLAGMAQSALALAGRFAVDTRLKFSPGATQDARVFSRWAEDFLGRCDRGRWLSPGLLEGALTDHARAGNIAGPARVELVGFPTVHPAHQSLLEALDRAGSEIDVTTLIAEPLERSIMEFPDDAAEAHAAVRWIRDWTAANPEGDIALIVPDPAGEWPTLEAVLREVLAPGLLHVAADATETPWEAESGPRLASVPVVAALLDLISWTRAALPLDRIAGVLLCPFFAAGLLKDRARFDAGILGRELLLRPELDLRSVLRLARDKGFPALSDWLSTLVAQSDRLAAMPPRQTFAQWTEALRQIARVSGWATDAALGRPLTAFESALADVTDAVLDVVATLDFAAQRVTLPEALEAVRRQASQTPVPANRAARLHIVSPASATGLPVAAALFLRASDRNLCTTDRPHPLLDWHLQRSASMPGTDAARDREAGERAIRRIADGCSALCLCVSNQGTDHPEPQTFAFTLGCKLINQNNLLQIDASAERDSIEEIPDNSSLPALPSRSVSGGARVLELQAACGFLAFAEMRLGGRETAPQTPGFDAIESGNVLHRALDAFWEEVGSQDALRAMSFPEREAAIVRAIDSGVSRKIRLHDRWDEAYVALQKERMQSILRRWLTFELDRAPFTVLARESKASVPIGPLDLDVRLDRLDRLEDGGLVFVDYKTGSRAHPSAWLGERPDKPQLPLYALLAEPEELRGLAFAKVRAGADMQWAGWVSQEGILPGKGSEIHDLADESALWKSALESLASDFASGQTYVSPKSYAINCKRCSQRLLCRLDVEALMDSSTSEEDGDE